MYTNHYQSLYLAGTDVVRPDRVICTRGCRLSLFAVIVCDDGFTGVSSGLVVSGLVGSGSVGVVGLVVFVGFSMLVWRLRGIGAFRGRICSRVRCSCFPSRSTKYVLGSASFGRVTTVPGSQTFLIV